MATPRQETLPPKQVEIQAFEPEDAEPIGFATQTVSITTKRDVGLEGWE